MELSIDRIPKTELKNRYGIKTTALRDRLQALGIKPIVEGRKSYISGEDLAKLDELALHLEKGGKLRDFEGITDRPFFDNSPIVNDKITDIVNDSKDPFIDLLILQRIADFGWLINTSRLALILGISPRSLNKKKIYYHCGFACLKAGKQRGENVWSVKMLGENC